MRLLANVVGFAGLTCGCTQNVVVGTGLDEIVLPSPPIPDCATDYRLRGQPLDQPIEPSSSQLAELDRDLKGGIQELRVREPLCLYLVPNGLLLLRDARGIKHYFGKYPRWDYIRLPDSPPIS